MPTPKPKPRPDRSIELVVRPELDPTYVHFEHSADHPFEADAAKVTRRNAWWLADAALLAYWDAADVTDRYARAGLESRLIERGATQCYVAWAHDFVIVTFRGTQPDQWGDLFDIFRFKLAGWYPSRRRVHRGFKEAILRVWEDLRKLLKELEPRPVWFGGHSLGAALAVLAADRYGTARGVSTLGSPRIGDAAFAAGFDRTYSGRSLRYVCNVDIVTHVPPEEFHYSHTAGLRQIDAAGNISGTAVPDPCFFPDVLGDPRHVLETIEGLEHGTLHHAPGFLLDHMPKGYAVDLWNDYVAHASDTRMTRRAKTRRQRHK
jgi:triacylglycerol lipase